MLLELLSQVKTGIQRLYILFIVCMCAYSPVWCFLDPEVSVDAMWSTLVSTEMENFLPTAKTSALPSAVGRSLGVCHSLVH